MISLPITTSVDSDARVRGRGRARRAPGRAEGVDSAPGPAPGPRRLRATHMPGKRREPECPSNHRPEGCYSRHGMLGPQSEESMNPTNRAILDGALVVARETGANAILLAAALPDEAAYLRDRLGPEGNVIAARWRAGAHHGADVLSCRVRIRRAAARRSRSSRPRHAIAPTSASWSATRPTAVRLDTVALVDLGSEEDYLDGQATHRATSEPGLRPSRLRRGPHLCVELGRRARERPSASSSPSAARGGPRRSHPLVLNPSRGTPIRQILDVT